MTFRKSYCKYEYLSCFACAPTSGPCASFLGDPLFLFLTTTVLPHLCAFQIVREYSQNLLLHPVIGSCFVGIATLGCVCCYYFPFCPLMSIKLIKLNVTMTCEHIYTSNTRSNSCFCFLMIGYSGKLGNVPLRFLLALNMQSEKMSSTDIITIFNGGFRLNKNQ